MLLETVGAIDAQHFVAEFVSKLKEIETHPAEALTMIFCYYYWQ